MDMELQRNMVTWFEIPVNDLERAVSFYETVFDVKLDRYTIGPAKIAAFPRTANIPGAPGALVNSPNFGSPSANSTLLYFNAKSGDLQNELSKVTAAGGKILQEKTFLTEENGYMAVLMDTEGNRIGLHSFK